MQVLTRGYQRRWDRLPSACMCPVSSMRPRPGWFSARTSQTFFRGPRPIGGSPLDRLRGRGSRRPLGPRHPAAPCVPTPARPRRDAAAGRPRSRPVHIDAQTRSQAMAARMRFPASARTATRASVKEAVFPIYLAGADQTDGEVILSRQGFQIGSRRALGRAPSTRQRSSRGEQAARNLAQVTPKRGDIGRVDLWGRHLVGQSHSLSPERRSP